MKNTIAVQVRVFSTVIRDERTGEKMADEIAITKDRLNAAREIGIGSEDLIYRLYNRRGYRVLDIKPPAKAELEVDLLELYHEQANRERAAEEVNAPDAEE